MEIIRLDNDNSGQIKKRLENEFYITLENVNFESSLGLAIFEEDTFVGVILVVFAGEDPRIQLLFVEEEYRFNGIGSLLISVCALVLAESGFERLRVTLMNIAGINVANQLSEGVVYFLENNDFIISEGSKLGNKEKGENSKVNIPAVKLIDGIRILK